MMACQSIRDTVNKSNHMKWWPDNLYTVWDALKLFSWGCVQFANLSIVFRAGCCPFRSGEYFAKFEDIGRYCAQRGKAHLWTEDLAAKPKDWNATRTALKWVSMLIVLVASSFREWRCRRNLWLFNLLVCWKKKKKIYIYKMVRTIKSSLALWYSFEMKMGHKIEEAIICSAAKCEW